MKFALKLTKFKDQFYINPVASFKKKSLKQLSYINTYKYIHTYTYKYININNQVQVVKTFQGHVTKSPSQQW